MSIGMGVTRLRWRNRRSFSRSRATRLVRREHVQITAVAAFEIAVVPEREPQEGQRRARFRQLHHACLLAIDRQLEATFQRRFHPILQTSALVAGQDDEVIRVPHQAGLGPCAGAIVAVEPLARTSAGTRWPARARSLPLAASPASSRWPSCGPGRPFSTIGASSHKRIRRQHRAIGDPHPKTIHQLVVRDRIEVPFRSASYTSR